VEAEVSGLPEMAHLTSSAECHEPVHVVGQDPESDADSGSLKPREPCSPESVVALEATDPPFASGSPPISSSLVPGSFDRVSSALARDHLVDDASGDQRLGTDDIAKATISEH
jgi:hypothetical protein